MNERANEIAAQSNELNMITKIVDFQIDRYYKIEQLLYRYCELMDSNSINSVLIRVKKRYAREQEEADNNRRYEFSKLRIESQIISSNISMILSQDCREKSEKEALIKSMKELYSVAFPSVLPFENGKKYLNSIDEQRKEFVVYMVKYLSDYSSDINQAMYCSMTLAEVRNLFYTGFSR